MPRRRDVRERFEEKIYPDPNSGCWLWGGGIGASGYGQMSIGNRSVLAHRLSWTLYAGPITGGLFVLHKCNNRTCANPNHLYLGTQKQNNEDTFRAGRHYFKTGRLNPRPRAKLTEPEVAQIYRAEGSQRSIAACFGVSQSIVSEIKAKKIWSHVNADS